MIRLANVIEKCKRRVGQCRHGIYTRQSLCFSSEKTLAKFIKQKGIEYFSVEQGKISKYNDMNYGNELWKNNSKQYIDANCKYIFNNIRSIVARLFCKKHLTRRLNFATIIT